ncbi:hypothetical protein N0O92_06450 [Alkalihalobacillus sp. MEB130]|uniref:hypothetical protein n=1 Tax=Alkalihalobacillus sp. MEB130 TaxID=2976704 RepID=UPI0028DDBE6C|nr:hypothetical protein [Alkalihalobacillus sp. MEB130]MDT8859868.1 hypothetical protein [Alkalihalobacillus sp. MEB130]
MTKRYHCCATCMHFSAKKKTEGGMRYDCIRLGYETKPTYTFSCWDPKEHIKRLMEKENQSS